MPLHPFLPPAMKLGQGNIFRSVRQQFCPQGGMHGCLGGHVWLHREACVVLFGGVRGFIWGACMVLFEGGMHGFFSFFGYNEIWSMSGQYASYWNAFLFPPNLGSTCHKGKVNTAHRMECL